MASLNKTWRLAVLALRTTLALVGPGGARAAEALPHTVEVGVTGFANKRPVVAAACLKGCPWGELGEYIHEAMAPLGYDVVLCENCNRQLGPGLVGEAGYPPPLTEDEMALGALTRVNARIDFGVTTSGLLGQAFRGRGAYAGRPYPNLRLITRIEDPYYVLIGVKASSGVTDLAQVKQRKLPVKILFAGDVATRILDYYGLSRDEILAWGGSFKSIVGAAEDEPFDLLISSLGGAGYNPETSFWTTASQRFELRFLEMPEPLLARLAEDGAMERVTARCCLLRGFTRSIKTVGTSGEAIFGRADMPDQVAYDIAKAADRNRSALKWFVRPYSYDPDTAWRDAVVPLHPGAERYFREKGYLPKR
jgi:TRAP-type uncharacterized transport system substrate-binding protein